METQQLRHRGVPQLLRYLLEGLILNSADVYPVLLSVWWMSQLILSLIAYSEAMINHWYEFNFN